MKLLYLVPHRTSDLGKDPSYVRRLKKTLRSVARADTRVQIQGLTEAAAATKEVIYWQNHPRIVAEIVETMKKMPPSRFDGVIIGDVGLVEAKYALRELLDVPVVHAGEAGFTLSQLMGERFAMLTYDEKVAAWLLRILREYALEDKCVSVRTLHLDLEGVMSGQQTAVISRQMLRQAREAITEDRAEVIFVASAGFVGLADRLREGISAPVIDPVEAAVKIAEMLVDLKRTKNLSHSKVATWKYP